MLKKLLTITLIFSLFCEINTKTSSAWWWKEETINPANACEKMNKCGEIENLDCAISNLKRSLVVAGYKELTQVGKKCEYNLHMWDYRELDNFPEQFGELLENAQNGYLQNSAVVNVTNEIGGLFNIDGDLSKKILKKFLVDNEYNTLSKEQLNDLITKIFSDIEGDYATSNVAVFFGGSAGGVVA